MQSGTNAPGVLFAAMIVSLCFTSAGAQQIRFTDFSSIENLQLNGSAHQATWQNQDKTYHVLRLTDGPRPAGNPERSSVFFAIPAKPGGGKQPVNMGFTTYFEFAMHSPASESGPAEGLVFLIQNSSKTDSTMGATGAGITALGAGADPSQFGAMGYAGIYNSLAIEFDIAEQSWDPTSNHVAIQSCGSSVNTPVHLTGTYTIGDNHDVTSCLLNKDPNAITSNIGRLADGNIHQVVIEYRPGGLQIWLDPEFIKGTHTPKPTSPPILKRPYRIDGTNALVLDSGKAWVGFAASQSDQATTQDILAWEFTPHTATSIQQVINNNGQTNTFTFGGHDQAVTYPAGSNPNGLLMTVTATPTDAAALNARIQTVFPNEQCVTYLGTGGNCMLYSVTCQDPNTHQNVTCPKVTPPPFIALSTSYFTTVSISDANADYLKADPNGTNNWVSICNPPGSKPPCYDPNTSDGTTNGKGQDLSDLVATFKPTTGQQGEQPTVAEPPKPVATEPQR